MEHIPLTDGLRYTATVLDVKQAAATFPKSGTGETMYCHQLTLKVDQYSNDHAAQWCNSNPQVTEFKVGDDIAIIAAKYNVGKGNQTVKFEKVVRTSAQKIASQAISKTQLPPEIPVKEFKDPGQVNPNPMVHGTIWATCLFNAVTFHKHRRGSTTQNVMDTADEFFQHFQSFTL